MLRKANNVFSVLLDDNSVAIPGGFVAGTTVVTSSNLPAGAVCLVNLGNVYMSNTEFAALGANDKFMLVQGKGANH